MHRYRHPKGSPLLIARDHFFLELPELSFIYCNIRKNGCSSFRRLFRAHSHAKPRPQESNFELMKREHRVWHPWGAAGRVPALFVYRDPVARIVSLYTNKLRDRKGGEHLAKHFQETTGMAAGEVTLDDFVQKYVALRGSKSFDPHLRSQASHLVKREYVAIHLTELHESMSQLLRQKRAKKFFVRPKNPSRSEKPSPSEKSRRIIENVYREDCELLDGVHTSPLF